MTEPPSAGRQPTDRELIDEIAAIVSWGRAIGKRLVHPNFDISILTDGNRLGFTEVGASDAPVIHVSIRPILDYAAAGLDIVKGLVLHEMGHHLFPKRDPNMPPMSGKRENRDKNLVDVLNILTDEHLERNLRAADKTWGNLLHTTASFLIKQNVRTVQLPSGPKELKAVDMFHDPSLAHMLSPCDQFFLALRLGQDPGKHLHPKAREALELMPRRFRRMSLRDVRQLARRLWRVLFDPKALPSEGFNEKAEQQLNMSAADLAQRKGTNFGEVLKVVLSEARDREAGASVGRQRAERVLQPPSPGEPGRPLADRINLPPGLEFPPFRRVVDVPRDASLARDLERQVAREARLLTPYFKRFDSSLKEQFMLLRGRRIDLGALRKFVLSGSPRILVDRVPETDVDFRKVFVGILVDASGSMGDGGKLETAQLFAAVIAKCVQQIAGIEARFYGFDCSLFLCGDALSCSVAGLRVGGSTNEAAGLQHVFNDAIRSRRPKKLVIVISDGAPDSPAAVKHLLAESARRHRIKTVQVAVARIHQPIYRQFVDLSTCERHEAIVRFGRLVLRALNS